jgi:hypothetical protein
MIDDWGFYHDYTTRRSIGMARIAVVVIADSANAAMAVKGMPTIAG